jgi:hypothetical protein
LALERFDMYITFTIANNKTCARPSLEADRRSIPGHRSALIVEGGATASPGYGAFCEGARLEEARAQVKAFRPSSGRHTSYDRRGEVAGDFRSVTQYVLFRTYLVL